MGRNNKEYSKSMHQQAYDRLAGMQAFGQSKAEAIADGSYKNKIFSYNTYQTYWKHTKYFIAYLQCGLTCFLLPEPYSARSFCSIEW